MARSKPGSNQSNRNGVAWHMMYVAQDRGRDALIFSGCTEPGSTGLRPPHPQDAFGERREPKPLGSGYKGWVQNGHLCIPRIPQSRFHRKP